MGPRPGGTDGERASGTTTKILSVGRKGIGTSTVVQGNREGGGGGRRETGTARIERELKRSLKQARYPGDAWRRDERLKTIAGGAVS